MSATLVSSPAASSVRIYVAENGSALGEADQCLIAVTRGELTQKLAEQQERALINLANRYPGNCAYISVIEVTAPPPPSELRAQSMQVFRSLGDKVSCIGVVIEGTELRSALIRAVLTGMTMFVPKMPPTRICRDHKDAAKWVVQKTFPGKVDLEHRLTSAIEVIRSKIPGN